jgi:hypothetical protein
MVLVCSPVEFSFALQYITTFYCVSMFSIMTLVDMFRAMFVSFCTYAKPENRTRALTLVRLANLGFAGPALGG